MKTELGDFIEAAGLLEYDPVAISKIYRGHPKRFLKRLRETLIPISLYFLNLLKDKLLGLLKNSKQKRIRAKEFTDLLVQLGPAFIKAGQALSTRPDIIPPIVLEELAQLQDQLPGFESELAMACIEQDLNAPIEEIFTSLEETPISAASLGQVHKGILKNGVEVAVKVQRPGLREQITLDLYIVRNIASWLNQNIRLIRSDLVALIDELGSRVFEEMDYLNEAKNAEKFAKLHLHNQNIAVPKIFHNATTRRVLTMEWIEGIKLTNIDGVKKLGINPDAMIDIGVNCSLEQLLEHGFFHADPHPGNLLALEDGRLCYLDFGMMSEVSREARTGLIQAVVHLVNRNFEKLSQDFVSLGFLAKNINLEPIIPAFESVFSKALEVGVNQMDFKAVTDDLSGVMYKFPFRVPPYYALIIRSLITLEGIALSVDPKFKILGAAYPYFARRLIEDSDPELRESLKEMIFDGNALQWNRLEDIIASGYSKSQLDLNSIVNDIFNFLFSQHGSLLRQQLAEEIISRLDSLGWYTIKKINEKLPKPLKSNRISLYSQNNDIEETLVIELEPIKQLIKISKTLPGFKKRIVLKQIPRIMLKSETRKIGFKIAQRVTEKGMVRLVKVAAGEP